MSVAFPDRFPMGEFHRCPVALLKSILPTLIEANHGAASKAECNRNEGENKPLHGSPLARQLSPQRSLVHGGSRNCTPQSCGDFKFVAGRLELTVSSAGNSLSRPPSTSEVGWFTLEGR
jgi:hypothetical protein